VRASSLATNFPLGFHGERAKPAHSGRSAPAIPHLEGRVPHAATDPNMAPVIAHRCFSSVRAQFCPLSPISGIGSVWISLAVFARAVPFRAPIFRCLRSSWISDGLWSGLAALAGIFRSVPGALPQAGMKARRWPWRGEPRPPACGRHMTATHLADQPPRGGTYRSFAKFALCWGSQRRAPQSLAPARS
jgi:hypothetical protein